MWFSDRLLAPLNICRVGWADSESGWSTEVATVIKIILPSKSANPFASSWLFIGVFTGGMSTLLNLFYRLESLQGSFTKEWSTWEKSLKDVLFAHANYLNDVQVVIISHLQWLSPSDAHVALICSVLIPVLICQWTMQCWFRSPSKRWWVQCSSNSRQLLTVILECIYQWKLKSDHSGLSHLWPLLYSQTKCWMRWKRSVAKSSSFDHLMYSSWCGEPVKSGLLISQSCSKFLLSCDKIQNWHFKLTSLITWWSFVLSR